MHVCVAKMKLFTCQSVELITFLEVIKNSIQHRKDGMSETTHYSKATFGKERDQEFQEKRGTRKEKTYENGSDTTLRI